MEQPRKVFKVSICNILGLKNVKKGYIELIKKIYLETLKSVLGCSISHYCAQTTRNQNNKSKLENKFSRRNSKHYRSYYQHSLNDF